MGTNRPKDNILFAFDNNEPMASSYEGRNAHMHGIKIAPYKNLATLMAAAFPLCALCRVQVSQLYGGFSFVVLLLRSSLTSRCEDRHKKRKRGGG